jgi:hypothetical protein
MNTPAQILARPRALESDAVRPRALGVGYGRVLTPETSEPWALALGGKW